MNAISGGMTVSDWRPLSRNSLRGFLTVDHPSGMQIHEVAVHEKNGSAWASPPSKPMVGKNGAALRDVIGKNRYQPLITFRTKQIRDRWSDSVIQALLAGFPDALR